ncbi:MAG TPA: ABC transporter substrate-binding protein [Pirellulales bacterium]|nr:ABC transporter substrate-binding protein [Pirellulales bacterium]
MMCRTALRAGAMMCCALLLGAPDVPSVVGQAAAPAQPPAANPQAANPPAVPAPAEIDGPTRLFEQEAYDELLLKRNDEVIRIAPLEFRELPDPATTKGKKLTIRKLDDADADATYEVAWSDIADVRFFEQMVLEEARKLIDEGKTAPAKFDEVYDYFDFLKHEHPKTKGLDAALGEYLFWDALHWQREKKYQEAMALWNELHLVYPRHPQLQKGIGLATEAIAKRHADDGNYLLARRVLRALAGKYPRHTVVSRLEKQWADQARGFLDEARGHFEAGQQRQAWEAGLKMLDVWPKLPEGRAIMERIYAKFPLLTVGVISAAGAHGSDRLIDWAARRNGRLRHRLLLEFTGIGPEGGEYGSPFGEAKVVDIGRRVVLKLRPNIRWSGGRTTLTGNDVARALLWFADGGHAGANTDWVNLFGGVDVRNVYDVDVDLRWSHVRPLGLLQFPIVSAAPVSDESASPAASLGPYPISKQEPEETCYEANPNYFAAREGQLREITEVYFADLKKARAALEAGKIQVLDRLAPWEVDRFRDDSSLVVEPYLLPSIHCLLPNVGRPLPGNSSFRRALVYAIDRELILKHNLLHDEQPPRPGCRVVSGPFPIGSRGDDPIRYAYDKTVEIRPFDQRLAIALAGVALKQVSDTSEKKGLGKVEKMPTLVLAHPPHPIARVACMAIQKHLQVVLSKVGAATAAAAPAAAVPAAPIITLRELPVGVVVPSDGDYDLLYLEMVMQDPIVDAGRLLGAEGVAGGASPYLNLALRKLAKATGWKGAHAELHKIHQLAADEVAVVPLWQLSEFFAYHKSVRGIVSQPVLLYQNVEQWQGQLQLAMEDE